MKTVAVVHQRIYVSDDSFMDVVIWRVPQPVRGSGHSFKYRLAYVIDEVCVLRYDNEAGKGDHRHIGAREVLYRFVDVETLLDDFYRDVREWKP